MKVAGKILSVILGIGIGMLIVALIFELSHKTHKKYIVSDSDYSF